MSEHADGWVGELLGAAGGAADDALSAVDLAVEFGRCLPHPNSGRTWERWQILASLAALDLTVARVYEAHTDALAILAEAGHPAPDGSWGVFAAESAASRLDAVRTARGWTLTGVKPWCSLGDQLDHALVTAHTAAGRRLFAVDLSVDGVRPDPAQDWVARGLRTVVSVPVRFNAAPGVPVGAAGWYLTRPGFTWGGLGVAACWLGGAEALADSIRHWALGRGADDRLAAMHLGSVDAANWAARTSLAAAAAIVDSTGVDGGACTDPELLALRVRAVVAEAVETTLRHAGHALGPAPLGFDADFARRVADLQFYVRQHHAEADLAALGTRLIAEDR